MKRQSCQRYRGYNFWRKYFEPSLRVVFNLTYEELNKCFEADKTVGLKIKTEK
jgi:hypothetical protein